MCKGHEARGHKMQEKPRISVPRAERRVGGDEGSREERAPLYSTMLAVVRAGSRDETVMRSALGLQGAYSSTLGPLYPTPVPL